MRSVGLGSLAEMRRDLTKLSDPSQRDLFRQAFVKTFYHTRQPGARPYYEAMVAARKLIKLNPRFAPAQRCLAYATLHQGGDLVRAIAMHRTAIATDPTYAEAHYMLALLLVTQGKTADGARHFAKAQGLGMPDYYGLSERFRVATQPTTRRSSAATD